MALTSSAVRNRGHYEPLPGGVHFVPFPEPLRIGGGSADAALATTMAAIDELFATLCYPDYVAAFLVGLALAGRLQSVFAAWSDGARDRLEGKVPGQVGATAIEQTNGAGGRRGVGTTNHCVHGSEVILEDLLDWRPFDYLTDMNSFFHGGPKAMSTIELEPTATGTRVHHRLAPPKKAADRDMLDQMAAELEVALKASLGSLSANAQTETVARAGGAAEPPLPRPKSSDGVLASVQPIEIIG